MSAAQVLFLSLAAGIFAPVKRIGAKIKGSRYQTRIRIAEFQTNLRKRNFSFATQA